MTASERATIALARKFDPLPKDCYYDGGRFIDEFGDIMKEHPHMQR